MPCIKLWGPVRQKADLTRPVPTPIDEVIEPENVMLLQFLYEGNWRADFSSVQICYLAKEARQILTSSVTSPSLRYALLLYAGIVRRPGTMGPLEIRNSSLARQSLLKKTVKTLDEEDLLASAVLALVAHRMSGFYSNDKRVQYSVERKVHMRGFVSILSHLLENSEIMKSSGLAMGRPLVRDLVLWLSGDSKWPEFFRSYWFARSFVGPISFHRRGYISSYGVSMVHQYSYGLMLIEHLLIKAVEARLFEFDDYIDMQWVDIAVQDVRDDFDYIAERAGEFRDLSNTLLSRCLYLSFGICRIFLALLGASDLVTGFREPAVTESALSLSEPLCGVLQYCSHPFKDMGLFGWEVRRALCLLLLAIPIGVDLRSVEFLNSEFYLSRWANFRQTEWTC